MEAECCRSRVAPAKNPPKNRPFSNQVDQPNRVRRSTVILLAVLLPISLSSPAQSYLPHSTSSIHSQLVHGSVVTAQGQPVAGAAVEIRDLRGIEVGRSSTNSAGAFVIRTAAGPGEYIVLAATQSQIRDERVALDRSDLEVRIALPEAASDAAPSPQRYVVSETALGIPGKAWAHLRSAQKEFGKASLDSALREIDRALQADPEFAQAFSMRALIHIARKDLSQALQDAEHATSLDPFNENAYLTLGAVYNSLHEFEKAEKAEERSLSMSPGSWQAQLEMAKSLYGQGQYVLALRELDVLQRDFPDVHLVRGNVLMRLDRRPEALGEFDVFVREAPSDPRGERIQQIAAMVRQAAPLTDSVQR